MRSTSPFPPSSRRLRRGFTLIEILVAVTIFAIVSLIIFTVFRTGIRTQRVAQRETEVLERGRFALDSLDRDMTNIFFRDETSYNVALTNALEMMEQARLRAEESGDFEEFYRMYGRPAGEAGDDDEKPTEGNPYEKGRLIDLQMAGNDGGDLDSISFAALAPPAVGFGYFPLGVARVEYRVDNGVLTRVAKSVETESKTPNGEILRAPQPPEVAPLAEGVRTFDLTYAFWYDNQWYEAKDWASSNRVTRNPNYILSAPERDETEGDGRLRPGDPGYEQFLNDQKNEVLDRLPAYVRVRLVFEGEKDDARPLRMERIIRLPPSVETYSPNRGFEEEQREEERVERDAKYLPIFPSTMKKQ